MERTIIFTTVLILTTALVAEQAATRSCYQLRRKGATAKFFFDDKNCLAELPFRGSEIEGVQKLRYVGAVKGGYTLRARDLTRFAKLETLITNHIGMDSIDSTLTDQQVVSTIQTWDASNNTLKSIPDTFIFVALRYLKEIYLSFNLFQLTSTCFEGFLKLEKIDLSNNQIDNIDGQAFAPLQYLTSLDLSNNKIKKLNDQLFIKNHKLNYLNLENNILRTFDYSIFSLCVSHSINVRLPTSQITEFYASCKGRSKCLFEGFQNDEFFANIEIFDASNNHLQIDEQFLKKHFNSTTLVKLDLANNYVTTLKKEMLSNFTYITEIDLSHTNLTTIEECAFCNNKSLMKLHLSHNNISELISAFGNESFTELHDIFLYGNNLNETTLNALTHKFSPSIIHINE